MSIGIILGALLWGIAAVSLKTVFYKNADKQEIVLSEDADAAVDLDISPIVSTTVVPTPSVEESDMAQTSISTLPTKSEKGPYSMQIDIKKTYEAVLTTSEGAITIQLYASETPITVNNFVSLSKKKYYNNTIFHRVIKGFMIQGGDPKGNGTGGPGYTFNDEPFKGEYTRGTLAMANAGPNTNGSQFFIMHQDYPLPKNYVIFGKVLKGLEVVDAIANAKTKTEGEGSTPVAPVTITSVEIVER